MEKAGRKPESVWIDGERIASVTEARRILKVTSKEARAFRVALEEGGDWKGHSVGYYAPKKPRAPYRENVAKPAHQSGAPLIRTPCVHRLGVYHGGRE